MNKIRVLIVDDSAVIRKTIAKALQKTGSIEVVGYAVNGLDAIEQISNLAPDLITLDIEMPVMDGLTTLEKIRETNKTIPIIMFSSLTHGGRDAAVRALTLGASECVGKPDHLTVSLESLLSVLQQELIPKIIELGKLPKIQSAQIANVAAADAGEYAMLVRNKKIAKSGVKSICIGSSTGGPMALMQIFSQMLVVPQIPIFIVQHMPPAFTAMLANRLNTAGAIRVREAVDGEFAEPGVAYLAPGGFHMKIQKVDSKIMIRLNTDVPENNCRPSVDVLFRAAANIYADNLLAIVLTGMGSDGLKGCQAISEKLGQVIVQDSATSIVWGMPGSVAQAGLADAILPIDKIPSEIVSRVNQLKAI